MPKPPDSQALSPQAQGAVAPPTSGQWVAGQVFVLDRVRIEVALEGRQRYKYVRPRVLPEAGGWKVVSPNCSRSVDREGGEIPIAWLLPLDASGSQPQWQLHAWHDDLGCWKTRLGPMPLRQALDYLVQDPNREFWR